MIKEITELNFPPYATLNQATISLQDMAEKSITTQVKIDGAVTPDFTYDWEVEFRGEKYIMPLRQPQGSKENTSLNSTIDLTFQHWAMYQLKRWYFFTIQSVNTGTAIADKYIASVRLNLKDFCALFNQVLDYYFHGSIIIDLNPEWEYSMEPTGVDVSYSYLWDVLIQFYDLWAVRWQIEANGNADNYVIKVGYPTSEVAHIFEYGFNGGLLKVQRQVQNDNIRNMLLGRGGNKNLPYRYFKDIDPENPSFPADPDWIPELRNNYFSELHGKTFRDYIKGWKTNPNRQLTEADGTPIAPYVVTYPIGSSIQTQKEPPIEGSTDMQPYDRLSVNIRGKRPLNIPEGHLGNFREGTVAAKVFSTKGKLLFSFVIGSKTTEELSSTVEISVANITLIDRATGEERTSVGIPEGSYDYEVTFNLYNQTDKKVSVEWICENPTLINSPIKEIKQDFNNPISVEPYNEKYAATNWAYKLGHEDNKFDPVEYVKDDASIVKYGELMGGLENNEEIYPSIQGVTVDPYGRIDEVVDVEQIISDDAEESAQNDAVISNIPDGTMNRTAPRISPLKSGSITFPKVFFSVSAGKHGTLDILDNVYITKVLDYTGSNLKTNVLSNYATIATKRIQVYEKSTGIERSSAGIPEGEYYYVLTVEVNNIDLNRTLNITVSSNKPRIITSTLNDIQWRNTFNIWVKNIWGTAQKDGESDAEYVERVWKPILGDHLGGEAKVVFSDGMLSTSEDYEFTILEGGIAHDTTHRISIKDANGHPTDEYYTSEWRLTLAKSDADLESIGLYVPSTKRQGNPGDHIFFVGIDMPHQYVLWAEERLDDYKNDQLDEVKDIKPTWVVSLDKVRINNEGQANALINQLKIGDSIRLADKRFILNEQGSESAYETLCLQSITYTYREPSNNSSALLPDIEIVLSDTYQSIANPVATLSGEINALSKQIGSLSNVEQVVRAVGDKLYLRKDGISDRSVSPTEFCSLVTGRNFRSGIVGGASWGIYQDASGNWVIEADRFKARQDLEVNDLVINQITARGGIIIESAAHMEVSRVTENTDGYVCYFDQHDGTVANMFHIDDVVYCSRFSPENIEIKFYKRRVIAISADSVTLTKGYAPVELQDGTIDTGVNGEGVPEEGDIITHYGNYTDTSRRYVKIRDVIGGGYERYIDGLDSVNAPGNEYYFAGKQNDYGPRWFIGNKKGSYAEWDEGGLYIKGNIEMGPESSGLDNIKEFIDVKEEASGVQFIKKIFPYGVLNNVATISQLLAVRNKENNEVVAGIYGGGVKELDEKGFSDEDHGKLMIFAGASDLDNVKTATTRIYEDGTLATDKLIANNAVITGEITAKSTTVGNLTLRNGLLEATYTQTHSDGQTYKHLTNIRAGLLYTQTTASGEDTYETSVLIGQDTSFIVNNECNPMFIESKASNNVASNIGIALDVYGASRINNALYIPRGNIRGFRLHTVRITYSQTLMPTDSIILVASTSTITLTLPSDAEDGQIYIIKNIVDGAGVNLKVGATGHYINDGKYNKKTQWSWSNGSIIIVIWDKENKRWQAGYTNYN